MNNPIEGFGNDVVSDKADIDVQIANQNNESAAPMGLSPEEILALQAGTAAAQGMPQQAANISPVEVSQAELIRELFELKARFNYLEAQYNQFCKEKGHADYMTSSIA